MPRPYAIDAEGQRFGAELGWDGEQLSVVLDAPNARYPILLDPAFETFVWEQANETAPAPAQRRGFGVANDGQGRPLIYGGDGVGTNDPTSTLYYDSTVGSDGEWVELTGASQPGQRGFFAMATPAVGNPTLFGGIDTVALSDTWELQGSTWVQVATTGPSARSNTAMAAAGGAQLVLMGGAAPTFPAADTWEWNGSSWSAVCGTSSPPTAACAITARRDHGMAWDGSGVIVYGGGDLSGSALGDTWRYDPSAKTWSMICDTASCGPGPRKNFALAYDVARKKIVLHGGQETGAPFESTWEYDPSTQTWAQTASSSVAKRSHGMAYDDSSGRMVLHGGTTSASNYSDDTWLYHARGGDCGSAADCNTGFCVDGKCCETACDQACETCSGNDFGLCASVVGQDDPGTCSGNMTCDGSGACKKALGQTCSSGAECVGARCVDGRCCENDCTTACRSCANAAGTCTTVVASQDDDNCSGTQTCSASGACLRDLGQTCSNAAQCAEGTCVDGRCCEDACTTPCRSCANSAGTCTTVVSSADDDNCSGNDTCDGSGACVPKLANGGSCGAAHECTSGHCVDGVCCDTACDDACTGCSTAVKGSGADGVSDVPGQVPAIPQPSPTRSAPRSVLGAIPCPRDRSSRE